MPRTPNSHIVYQSIDQPGNLYQCDREYNAEGKDLFLWLGKQESCAVGMWESRSDFQGRWEGWKTWGWVSRLSTERISTGFWDYAAVNHAAGAGGR